MSKVSYTIDDTPKPSNRKTNVFCVAASFMHGDGDYHNTEKYWAQSLDEIADFLQFAQEFLALHWNGRCDFCQRSSYRLRRSKAVLSDYFLHDCTNDGSSYAMLERVKVTYFNAAGQEFDVTVAPFEINDENRIIVPKGFRGDEVKTNPRTSAIVDDEEDDDE